MRTPGHPFGYVTIFTKDAHEIALKLWLKGREKSLFFLSSFSKLIVDRGCDDFLSIVDWYKKASSYRSHKKKLHHPHCESERKSLINPVKKTIQVFFHVLSSTDANLEKLQKTIQKVTNQSDGRVRLTREERSRLLRYYSSRTTRLGYPAWARQVSGALM